MAIKLKKHVRWLRKENVNLQIQNAFWKQLLVLHSLAQIPLSVKIMDFVKRAQPMLANLRNVVLKQWMVQVQQLKQRRIATLIAKLLILNAVLLVIQQKVNLPVMIWLIIVKTIYQKLLVKLNYQVKSVNGTQQIQNVKMLPMPHVT